MQGKKKKKVKIYAYFVISDALIQLTQSNALLMTQDGNQHKSRSLLDQQKGLFALNPFK